MIIRIYYYAQECKNLILRFKMGGVKRLSETMAHIMEPSLSYIDDRFGTIVLVPVPCSHRHQALFGWDHMMEVARRCTKLYGYRTLPLLKRVGKSIQKELDREQRMNAAEKAFCVIPGQTLPTGIDTIVVIDDVTTTGATIETCIQVLEQSFTIPIIGLCIAMD